MNVYSDLLQILAPFCGSFLVWLIHSHYKQIKADIRAIRATVDVLKKADVVADKMFGLFQKDIFNFEEKIDKLIAAQDRHADAMIILKTDLVRIQSSLEDVKSIKENYGKVITVLEKVAAKRRSNPSE
jgi:low affinity Fe/Cu permease